MIKLKQKASCLPADTQTPVSLYLGFVGREKGILLESSEVDGRLGRYSLLAWDFKLQLGCREGKLTVKSLDKRLDSVKDLEGLEFTEGVRKVLEEIEIEPDSEFDLPPMTRAVYGYFGYGMSGLLEPKLSQVMSPNQAEAQLVLPGRMLLFDHLHYHCYYLCLDNDLSLPKPKPSRAKSQFKVGKITTYPDQEKYHEWVIKTKELIRQGEAIQVVLSTRFEAPFKGDPFLVYRHLRRINPSPYTFFLNLDGISLMGSSPELMVKCGKNVLQLRPIAGTRPRGETEKEDQALADELLGDEKERAEHVMLVDLGRNDLGRIAEAGSVEVDKFMQVERFSHVMHLTSYLSAQLKENMDVVDILRASFPAGTVSGAPKIRAMEIISDMEDLPRGPYAGAIGWIGLDQGKVNMDTGITIRSLWIRDSKIHWQAGAGVVYDSVPEKEWQECANKAKAIRKALSYTGGTDDFAHRQL
ncbi:MAG: anthranilate synthase component I family protein [Desulfonatronovibrio sp. MSAO_Bac4]|nr:MAG: anthranilate synthase component I family protein [Desulfonatronovibrio sp. MSAO_Bac4]